MIFYLALIVALSGTDGAGKTTTVNLLVCKLARNYGLKVTYHHEFDFLFLRFLHDKMFRKLRASRRMKTNLLLYLKKGSALTTYIYDMFLWMDYIIRFIFYKLKEGIVICDRCVYDHLVFIVEEKRFNTLFLWAIFRILPKPDLIILLDVSPQVAYRRKKGEERHDISHYIQQRFLFLKLAEIVKPNRIVDSNRVKEEVVEDCLKTICSFLDK